MKQIHNTPTGNSIVQLNSLDDLKKIIFLQKTITSQAHNELLLSADDTSISLEEDTIEQAKKFVVEETKVLEKYAKYPTLTECQLMPNSYDGYKWGSTFGVTLLVGELIFKQLVAAHPQFTPAIRQLYIIFLTELDNPQHEYLIEPLEKCLKYTVTSESGEEFSIDKEKQFIRDLVTGMTDTMVAVSEGYGIIRVKKGGILLTPRGKRILLHLVDASKFVDEMTKAHTKFQANKPQFSMT
jgi:hypothetical protein